jgi:hypothetical protein
MTQPHLPPEASPLDAGFLHTFLGALLVLLVLAAAVNLAVDPLGVFGTGLLPPVVSADRDQKAALYRDRRPPPAIVILGSSRSKTIPVQCLERLTGRPGFNFAVNGAGTEDLLAIFRFLRDRRPDSVRALLIGLDPEALQGTGGAHRALENSRALAPYVGGRRRGEWAATLAMDLLGWQALTGSFESLRQAAHPRRRPAEMVLDGDGVQRYPALEDQWREGTLPIGERVAASIPGLLSRYDNFTALDADRLADLDRLVREARKAGVTVTAFIPPVHPAFERVALGTAWRARTEETVQLLQTYQAAGALRYVETRGIAWAQGDAAPFVDGVHFLAPVAARVVEAVTGRPDGCAVQ